MKFRLRFNPRAFISLIATTILLGMTHSVLVAALEYGGETPPLGLVIAARLSYALFVIDLLALAVYAALLVGTHLLPDCAGLFRFEPAAEEPTPPAPEEAVQVADLVEAIGKRLEQIETGQGNALVHLHEVNAQSSALLRAIRSMMRKRERMLKQVEVLDEALSAVGKGDRVGIARAAGKLEDGIVRGLLLELNHNGDADFGAEILDMISAQQGSLRSGAERVKELSLAWVNLLTDYRAQVVQLATQFEAMDSLRPVSLLDARLRLAQRELRMVESPDAGRLLQQAGLPLLEG